jgi:uncharacterized protein YecT (DUF1311 family)
MRSELFRSLALLSPWLALAACSAPADPPSLDCDEPSGAVEERICHDERLSALDREVTRLYQLARADDSLEEEQREELAADQRRWIEARGQCAQASDLDGCARASHVIRIHELRSGYPAARSQDSEGLSKGPFPVRCEGLDARVDLVFVSGDPGLAFLLWRDEFRILEQTRSASGARYAARNEAGETVFWIKGNDARFERPDEESLACHIEASE